MSKDIFKDLTDIYYDSVAEVDETGSASLFDEATTRLFNELREQCKVNIKDIQFLDGYFIFGMGTNSVVHFHIKECSGWKFGIWWNLVNSKDTDSDNGEEVEQKVCGTLFAQYEETIDKFKPTASMFLADITFYVKDNQLDTCHWTPYGITSLVNFVKKNPLHAWYRDYSYTDYNTEYISSVSLLLKFIGYKIHRTTEKVVTTLLDKYFVNYTLKLFKSTISDDEKRDFQVNLIEDEYCSPRFLVMIRLPKDSDCDPGMYSMFEEGAAEYSKWKKRKKVCDKIAWFFRVTWFTPIEDNILISDRRREDA